MRNFKLINSQGSEFDLMSKTAFFNVPSGLGFEITVDVAQIGYEFLDLKETLSQKAVTGEMVFASYSRYQDFAKFVTGEKLKLAYQPEDTWYYLDVVCGSLSKSEILMNHRLICGVTFVALSTWYEADEVIQSVVGGGNAKIYSYTYNYQYARTDLIACAVENVQAVSPCRLNIYGPAENPTWSVNQGSKRVSTGRVNITLTGAQKLVVDSRADTMEIAIYTASTDEFIEDVYNKSDFTTERFVYLPVGNSAVTMTGIDHAILEVTKNAYTV